VDNVQHRQQQLDHEHFDLKSCLRNDPAAVKCISPGQRAQLKRKSDHNITEENQWFVIWEILFPKQARPRSAYMDTGLSMELLLFRDYCDTHGPSTIDEEYLSSPIWSTESTLEQRRALLQMVISQGSNRQFEDYSRRSSRNSGHYGYSMHHA
jgi:hypothetical protein